MGFFKNCLLRYKANRLNKQYKPVFNGMFSWSLPSGGKEEIAYTLLIDGYGNRKYKVFSDYRTDMEHPYVKNHLEPWRINYKDLNVKITKGDIFYTKNVVINGKIIQRRCNASLDYQDINAD